MEATRYNKKLMHLTWPIFLESFLRMFLGNVNVLMLSKYSDKAVGAVGISNQIVSMVLVMYGIVSAGTAIIVSQYIGAKQRETAAKVANISLLLNLVFGIILSLAMALFARPILKVMNTPEDLIAYAYIYIVIVGAASFTQALMAAISAVARSFGHTKFPMYVALTVNALNIAGNYISIFRPFGIPSIGVTGIAVSVAFSQVVGVILSLAMYRKIGIEFKLKDFVPFPKDTMKAVLKVGVPAAGEYMSYNFSQMATTYIVTMFGAAAITTKVYAQNFTFFASTVGSAIGLGTQILVGQMAGAGKKDKAYKIGLNSVKIGITANVIIALIFMLFRRPLMSIFTKDPGIVELASLILVIDIFVEAGRALNNVVGNSLRGAGDVRFPVIISIISMWGVSVALCYILGIQLKLGLIGVWIAFAADECIRGLILLWRWRSKAWQKIDIIKAKVTA